MEMIESPKKNLSAQKKKGPAALLAAYIKDVGFFPWPMAKHGIPDLSSAMGIRTASRSIDGE